MLCILDVRNGGPPREQCTDQGFPVLTWCIPERSIAAHPRAQCIVMLILLQTLDSLEPVAVTQGDQGISS